MIYISNFIVDEEYLIARNRNRTFVPKCLRGKTLKLSTEKSQIYIDRDLVELR